MMLSLFVAKAGIGGDYGHETCQCHCSWRAGNRRVGVGD